MFKSDDLLLSGSMIYSNLLLFIWEQVELIEDMSSLMIFLTHLIDYLLLIINQVDLVYDLPEFTLLLFSELLFHLGTSRVERRYIQV